MDCQVDVLIKCFQIGDAGEAEALSVMTNLALL